VIRMINTSEAFRADHLWLMHIQ